MTESKLSADKSMKLTYLKRTVLFLLLSNQMVVLGVSHNHHPLHFQGSNHYVWQPIPFQIVWPWTLKQVNSLHMHRGYTIIPQPSVVHRNFSFSHYYVPLSHFTSPNPTKVGFCLAREIPYYFRIPNFHYSAHKSHHKMSSWAKNKA